MGTEKHKVPRVTRDEIDGWPIQSAGLPARVVNTSTRLKLKTVAELRNLPPERLLLERRFGRRSLAATEAFFDDCAALEAGKLEFGTLREVLDQVLEPAVWKTLALRYGLERPDLDASRQYFTLQSIANRDDITRERVRQVVDIGLRRLGERLPSAWMTPFERLLMDVARAQGGIAETDAFSDLVGHPAMGGLNPAATALLLCDAHPDRWVFFGRAFILAPARVVTDFARSLHSRLRRRERPLPGDDLLAAARDHAIGQAFPNPKKALPQMVAHMERVVMLRDGSCLATEHTADFLEQIIRELGGHAHYTDITDRYNAKVMPDEQRSASSMLRLLIASRRFRTTDLPGNYRLR